MTLGYHISGMILGSKGQTAKSQGYMVTNTKTYWRLSSLRREFALLSSANCLFLLKWLHLGLCIRRLCKVRRLTYSITNEAHRRVRWRSTGDTDVARRRPNGTPEFCRSRVRRCRPLRAPPACWRGRAERTGTAGGSRRHTARPSTRAGWTGPGVDRARRRHARRSAGASSASVPGSAARSAGKTSDRSAYSSAAWKMRNDDNVDDANGDQCYRWAGPQAATPAQVHKHFTAPH